MQISWLQKFTLVDYPGKTACVVFTPGCNLRCGFCHNPEFVLPEKIQAIRGAFLTEGIVLRFLEQRKGFLEWVSICGGEPTIHADLPTFVRMVKTMGFKVKLDTNGTNPRMLRELLEEGILDYVAMDLKHPIDRMEEMTGKQVPGDVYRESMRLIMERAPDYEFRTTVCKGRHGVEEIAAIVREIPAAKRYYLQNFRKWATLDPNFSGGSFAESELETLKATASQYVANVKVRS